jgi:nitroimidazol reductase NimA-like FMN-containing flavoprotein (pyridoxamine 5'-phosphate oxidase superfamily)
MSEIWRYSPGHKSRTIQRALGLGQRPDERRPAKSSLALDTVATSEVSMTTSAGRAAAGTTALPHREAAGASARARLTVHAERAAPDEAAAILAAGHVAHVGFAIDGQPFVIPMTYHFDRAEPGRLHLHGAHHSRLMQHLATGAPVCVEVTLLDGLVFSKTALYHSVNYRSVVVFARAARRTAAPDASGRRAMFEAMIARYHPGRAAGRDYEPIPDAHLDATAFVALDVDEWSAKVRRGGPKGPRDADPAAPGTAGVLPLGGGCG